MTKKKSRRVGKKKGVLGNELQQCSLHCIKIPYMTKKNTLETHQKNTYVGLKRHCIKCVVFSLSLGQKYSAYVHQGHLMSPTSASRLNRIFLTCRLHCIFLYVLKKYITHNMEVRQVYNSYAPIKHFAFNFT